MANRPFFIISSKGAIEKRDAFFEWFPGFSSSQKKKSINAFHSVISLKGYFPLEISTKSDEVLGVKLSAFSLKLGVYPLENVFQSSKIYENGGPYYDLLDVHPRDAKRDERHKNSGKLIGFFLDGDIWELEPKTAFYDYIYLKAVKECISKEELERLNSYTAFTDIEFNPQRSINCQARTVALLKLLLEKYGEIPDWSKDDFLSFHKVYVV